MPISDCEAAVPILNTGKHQFYFIGDGGRKNEFAKYPSLANIEENNSVWFTFFAPYDGFFTIKIISEKEPVQMIAFQTDPRRNLCEDIRSGKADIKRLFVEKKVNRIELKDTVAESTQFPIKMKVGEGIMFTIMSTSKKNSLVTMHIEHEALVTEELTGTGMHVQKIIDQRQDLDQSCVAVKVRDVESLLPVIAFIEIDGARGANGSYKASDLFLIPKHDANAKLRCFAQGYFYIDRVEPIFKGEINEINIWLEPISRGKAMILEDIQFLPGTSDFLPASASKLIRLKDFMVLNPRIKIEIQGHVMEVGNTTSAGQLLSEARAKKVAQYLVDAGIDKNRLRPVGYGGTKPIFAKPTSPYQEQANRRVEVIIF